MAPSANDVAACHWCVNHFQARPARVSKIEACPACNSCVHPKCIRKTGYIACCDRQYLTSITCHAAGGANAVITLADITGTLLVISQTYADAAAHHASMEISLLPSPPSNSMAAVVKETRPNLIAPPTFTLPPNRTRTIQNTGGGALGSKDKTPPTDYSTVVRNALRTVSRKTGDPLSSLAEAMCLMADGIHTAVVNTNSLTEDIAALKIGQKEIEGRVKKLEDSDWEKQDISIAALTRANECDIPEHPNSLTKDLIVNIGAGVGVNLSPDWVVEFWHAPR